MTDLIKDVKIHIPTMVAVVVSCLSIFSYTNSIANRVSTLETGQKHITEEIKKQESQLVFVKTEQSSELKEIKSELKNVTEQLIRISTALELSDIEKKTY